MVALNSERLDTVDMYWRLWSELEWAVPSVRGQQKTRWHILGWGWVWGAAAAAAAAELAAEVAQRVAEGETGSTAPCTP